MKFDPVSEYVVEPLLMLRGRSTFSCGVEALDRYFQQQIGQDIRRQVARGYVLIHRQSDAIAGFYTLANTALHLEDMPPELAKKLPKYPQVPATLLGRLAVDLRHRGFGLGEFMLLDALRRSLIASESSASFAVVVDAKDDAAKEFYRKFGFVAVVGSTHKLFLPMATLSQLLG